MKGLPSLNAAQKVPVGKSTFIPIEEGVESDHYLKLVGEAAKILRKEKAIAYNTKLNRAAPESFYQAHVHC